jgi:hypothetical protein
MGNPLTTILEGAGAALDYIPRLADGGLDIGDWISLWSGLGGAVIGAVIGGLIAWLLALQASRASAERDKKHFEESIKARSLRLMVKSSIMLSDIAGIQRSINESLEAANARGLTNAPLWQRVTPLVGSYSAQPFDADEPAALMALKENDLAQSSIELFQRHENFLIALKLYGEKRQGFAGLVNRHVDLGGGMLSSLLTAEEMNRVAPFAVELESLIAQVREMAPELRELAETVTFGIGPAVRRKLDTTDFPLMAPDPNKAD